MSDPTESGNLDSEAALSTVEKIGLRDQELKKVRKKKAFVPRGNRDLELAMRMNNAP